MKKFWACFWALISATGTLQAADPVVENVFFEQIADGSSTLVIHYDVSDADGDTLAVALQISDDGGATWVFPVINPQGDVGYGVIAGQGKTITVDLGVHSSKVTLGQAVARVVASDTGVLFGAHSPDCTAAMHLASTDWSDPAIIDSFSRADLLIVTGSYLWKNGSGGDIPVVSQLKARNPDQVIVGYVSAFSAKLFGENPDIDPFWHDWFVRTRPYWVYTTEGDTAQTWPGNVVINILDPDCRTAMVETIVEYQRESLNRLDGIYWDYFNLSLWSYGVDMHGEIDMDGNGIGHFDDPDERRGYRAAQIALVQALRDSLPGDLQIFNGQRAYGDSNFASLADGVMYELFPTLFFPQPNMANALNPDYENNLFNVRSWLRESEKGPFMVFCNPWRNSYTDNNGENQFIHLGDVFRAVALLTDGYACWNLQDEDTFDYTFGWPRQDISLGAPLGETVVDGGTLRRYFEYGEVEIEMNSGRYPNPFDYRIRLLGSMVEELAIPFHTP